MTPEQNVELARIRYEQAKLKASQDSRNHHAARQIIDLICGYYGIAYSEITNCTRKREVCEPREIAMMLIRKHTTLTFAAIAKLFNKKTHSGVLLNCNQVQNLKDTEAAFRIQYTGLDAEVKKIVKC